jgi:hypothetical protein
MGATTTFITIMDERVARRLDQMHASDEHQQLVRQRRAATVSELSGRRRLRNLAAFLDCDASALAEGLVEAVQRDPSLRVQQV